jgi:hypothetical protein
MYRKKSEALVDANFPQNSQRDRKKMSNVVALLMLYQPVALVVGAQSPGASSLQPCDTTTHLLLYPRDDDDYPGCPSRGSILGKVVLYQFMEFLSVLIFGHQKVMRKIKYLLL